MVPKRAMAVRRQTRFAFSASQDHSGTRHFNSQDGSGDHMYGVVLWRDHGNDRTLIWCEDHGNLAFSSSGDMTGVGLQSGDLVRFDIRDEGKLRIASNISLIAPDEYPNLADVLLSGHMCADIPRVPQAEPAKIVPFTARCAPRQETGFGLRAKRG